MTRLRQLGGADVEITAVLEYVGNGWSFQISFGLVLVTYHVLSLHPTPSLKVYLNAHLKRLKMVTWLWKGMIEIGLGVADCWVS